MNITQTVRTADNEPLAESVSYQGQGLVLTVRRDMISEGGAPPAALVVHVAPESRRVVRGRVEIG
jgi:hypothetical protein